MRRQLAAVQQMTAGSAVRGQLDIYRVGSFDIKRRQRMMVKMVVWLPREAQQKRSGVVRVCTDHDSLIVVLSETNQPMWVYHADHVRRWAAEHERTLRRLAEDHKAEQRPVATFAGRRAALVERHRNRMRSAVQQVAASVAGYAARRRFAAVFYDDSIQDFCRPFPWFALRERLRAKLDEYGIRLDLVSVEAAREPPVLLGDGEGEND
jgi:hypothetical protein